MKTGLADVYCALLPASAESWTVKHSKLENITKQDKFHVLSLTTQEMQAITQKQLKKKVSKSATFKT